MERVLMIGSFDFMGFHLTKKLLEMGCEVNGVALSPGHVHEEEMTDEIGRNDNFFKMEYSSEFKADTRFDTMIVPLYDGYISGNPDYFKKAASVVKNVSSSHCKSEGNFLTVLLLPIQLLYSSEETQEIKALNGLTRNILSESANVLSIYMPTVFGPFQPAECIFQKIMSGDKMAEPNRHERTRDAIFCRDAVEIIFQLVEEGNAGSMVLESEEGESWQECANILGIPAVNEPDFTFSDNSIQKIKVQKSLSIKEALNLQLRHTRGLDKELWFN